MKYKQDYTTRFAIDYIGSNLDNIDTYLALTAAESTTVFKNNEQINEYFRSYSPDITYGEAETIMSYTNRFYGRINSLKRGFWDYEALGRLTPEDKAYYLKYADDMEKIINKVTPLQTNISTYRGTDLKNFRRFGISSLDDLASLLNQYIYDDSFVSTSLLANQSFFKENKEAYNGNNIQIEYLIPKDSQDGLFVPLSFYDVESEYLINCGNLAKVIDVKIDHEKEEAYIKMILVPKKVWDKNYYQESQRNL